MAAEDIVTGVLENGLRPEIPVATPFVLIKLIEVLRLPQYFV
jgi:hypothetical protein